MKSLDVRDPSQVAEARRIAVALAHANGFDEADAGRVAIVASELATNLIKHGGGGELLVGSYDDSTGSGIELLSLDKGAGIANVGLSSRDGHSTAGSAGNGLGAIQRGSHFSDIYSAPDDGTAILARLQTGSPGTRVPAGLPDHGAISIAMPGEEACGDAWCYHTLSDAVVLMVADGLGHGLFAAEASHAAVRSFHRTIGKSPSVALTDMHAALRPTRGAAIAVARINHTAGEILYSGVGNIAGTVVNADHSVQRMVSSNGTIGHVAKHIRDFTYRLEGSPVVVLASDGLGTSWHLEDYPGLSQRHPTLIAGVLYRDHNRGRDDVTVLVARGAPPMSVVPQLTVALIEEADIIAARQRARQLADLLGFDKQDQTRIATAVSEIARNALSYGGGGRVEMAVETDDDPRFIFHVRDKGRGIADVARILEGRYTSDIGMGVGIVGTRRLMDTFDLASGPGGTCVTFAKRLPRGGKMTSTDLQRIGKALAATNVADPLLEVRTQNHELLESLAALAAKQEEAERLNAELESTNRGVVALHAELEEKAVALAALNAELEARVAAAVAECQQVNDTLRQSQKMEAVGQLTGGIAHDFNNLLQIVTGNLELLSRGLPEDAARFRRQADNAMGGAVRAATLTQRLLAFSRRQPLAPKPLAPNRLVDGMSDLMRRTLGEQVTIHIDLAGDLWMVEADANQLENAVLNLAVNARDAMPPGGKLTITSGNTIVGEADAEDDAAPGQYVSIAVCDTGAGMSEETMARVFEPFFTTKEAGKGTGLGLSMVYGFVKQSGGHLRIESSLGRGTSVTLFLPRFTGALFTEHVTTKASAEGARDGETVLLVEDDDGVRHYSASALTELGYAVIEVGDGDAAFSVLDGDRRIDILFTDVILAGSLTGRDVAERCHLSRPGTPIVYTSGYARDAIVHDDRLDEGIALLAKPFTIEQLATSLRTALDLPR